MDIHEFERLLNETVETDDIELHALLKETVDKSIDLFNKIELPEDTLSYVFAMKKLAETQQSISKYIRGRSERPNDVYVDTLLNNKILPRGSINLIIAIEELAEMQQAMISYICGEPDRLNTLEETADSIVAMKYIRTLLDITPEDVNKALRVKVDRLWERLLEIETGYVDKT